MDMENSKVLMGGRGEEWIQNNVYNVKLLYKRRMEMRTFLCICLYAHKKLGKVLAFGDGNWHTRKNERLVTVQRGTIFAYL